MAFIDTASLAYPLTLRQVRQANPNVSLPKEPDEATLNALGFATVQPTERPTGDVVTEGQPEQQADGAWAQTWEVRSYTEAELQTRIEQWRSTAVVSRRQAKQQLVMAGLLDQVQPTIDAISDATEWQMVQIYWDDSQEFERDNPQLIQLATAMGLGDAELDELFKKAKEL